jgi:Integrase core domain
VRPDAYHGTQSADTATWSAKDGGERQRHRVHQQRNSELAGRSQGEVALLAPGKPGFQRLQAIACRARMQNGFIESFNGKLRDEKLNDILFSSLRQARVELATWRNDYNHQRRTQGSAG